ncbi:MAG: cryptochrome/photolyase family protein, partial [Candidatus Omnitrophica bacterium]|nr:cryptochrome/photolyase family protein [Candidatus Omnitrophota bacterium]
MGVWIQPEQLSHKTGLLRGVAPDDATIILIEPSANDLSYTPHKKKLVLILSLLRHFAEELREEGRHVVLYRLDERRPEEGRLECLNGFISEGSIERLRVMQSSEYDEQVFLESLAAQSKVPVDILPNDRFMVGREEFAQWHESEADPTMERFYETRRKQTGLLMEGGEPAGGHWNYDTENRVPPVGNLPVPELPTFEPDPITLGALETVETYFADHPGSTDGFCLPVRGADIEEYVDDFIENRLRLFGMYQDAMVSKSHVVYHSRLSAYLNHGLIEPMELLRRVEEAYRSGTVPLNSAEGFIRQILGWREYVHGIYWMRMPEYREENPLDHQECIPEMMRTGETLMKCVKSAVQHSLAEGYIHHIERLMIVGNFGLLIGVHPKNLIQWFREMYVDSADWATLPNVMGLLMATDGAGEEHGDSFGSKPYAASAHYIGTMSDYCKGCFYNGKKRLGEKACPFNYLYWNFVGSFQNQFQHNPRMKNAVQMYRLKPKNEKELIEKSSVKFLGKIRERGTDRVAPRAGTAR